MSNNNLDVIRCMKCNNTVPKSQGRTYHLALKNNLKPGSWLSRTENIVICFKCDNMRATNLVEFLNG